MLKICRRLATFAAGLACITLLVAPSAIAQETEDSQIFLSGFNAYQQKNYPVAVSRLDEVLQKHPDTPLRDMVLFWLARANYKAGNKQDAARYMAQFNREYPDNPLKNTVEDELLTLADQYEKSGQAAQAEARQKAETDRLAQEQAAREATEKAKKAQLLKAKAEAEQAAKLKAEAEKQRAAEAAAQEARKKIEAERLAAQKLEEARKAKAAAEQKQLAAVKAEEARKAKAEAERLAAQKAREERATREKAQKDKQAAEQRLAEDKRTKQAAAAAQQSALREKAIAGYQGIVSRFPGTPAAAAAAARLKELGVTVPAQSATVRAAGTVEPVPADNSQVLSLEVAQYAAFAFTVQGEKHPTPVSQRVAIPFELQNRGNGADSFYLASGFPAEYGVRFAAAATPDQTLNQTPVLAPGERFNGLLQLVIPADTIDGLRITYPVKAASRFNTETSQSRELTLTASAPLLRAVIKADKAQALPGERVTYRVTLLNVGSMVAHEVTLRLNFPPQYEPAEFTGFRQEMQAALVQDGLVLKPGESRDFVVSFTVKGGAAAHEELTVRADLINAPLKAVSTFHAAAVSVKAVSAVSVRMASNHLVVIPGQTITLPVTVVNNGNQRERFSVVASVPSAQKVTIYQDLNRDGLRQPNEPEVTTIGPLGPKEEAALLLEVATNGTAQDGSEMGVDLRVAPESGLGAAAVANAHVSFSRPVLQLALKGRGGSLVPGDLLTADLVVTNQGSNLAKGVELQASWPAQLELVASEPAAQAAGGGSGAAWQLHELGAGEKRVVKASFRVRPGTGVGTGIQVKSRLSYYDQLGNRY